MDDDFDPLIASVLLSGLVTEANTADQEWIALLEALRAADYEPDFQAVAARIDSIVHCSRLRPMDGSPGVPEPVVGASGGTERPLGSPSRTLGRH